MADIRPVLGLASPRGVGFWTWGTLVNTRNGWQGVLGSIYVRCTKGKSTSVHGGYVLVLFWRSEGKKTKKRRSCFHGDGVC
jgi:hypothetical protein